MHYNDGVVGVLEKKDKNIITVYRCISIKNVVLVGIYNDGGGKTNYVKMVMCVLSAILDI